MNNIIPYLLYPKKCVSCDEALDFARYRYGFCVRCAREIKYACEPVCKICGKVLSSDNDELCLDCSRVKHFFVQCKGVYVYQGGIKAAMYRFKYNNRRCYKYTFTKDIIRRYGAWIKTNRIEAIVPVPMYKSKKLRRGYNQSEIIAAQLSKEVGIPMYPDVVVRNRPTTPMKGLSNIERQKNLKNAFNFCEKGLQLRKVLVIDDIYTTGATIDAVAKALLQGGVIEVYGLCVCVGRGY